MLRAAGYGPWPRGRPAPKALIGCRDTVLGTHKHPAPVTWHLAPEASEQ
jgi:hypothetical protein